MHRQAYARRPSFLLLVATLMVSLGGCATSDHAGEGPHAQHHGPAPEHAHAGMHHRFEGAEEWAKRFDDPARDAWQRPEAVLDRLGLQDGMRVADIGSGTGYFAVRLAGVIPNGRVYGIDIEPDMVRYLRDRATREGLENLESRLGLPDDPLLPNEIDLVLVVDTYHHMADRTAYFARLGERLADGGRVAIVDFKMGELPVGPPDSMKISADTIIQELESAGYQVKTDDRELLPYQVLLIFQAPRR